MRAFDVNSVYWGVLCLGLGGTALGVLCQLWEARGRRGRSVLLPAVLAATFAGLGVVAWITGQPGGVLLSGAGVTAVAALRWGGRLKGRCRAAMDLFVRPQTAWNLLLVACVLSAIHLAYHSAQEDQAITELTPEAFTKLVGCDEWQAETDCGQEIPLFHFDVRPSVGRMEETILARNSLRHQVIRVAAPDSLCNCHGWVFTGGRGGVPSRSVDRILSDNHYQRLAAPKQGDLIVYRDEKEAVQHTGIVEAIAEDGLILIKSKWGPIGLYVHPPDMQPWGTHYAYYRSPRRGHELKLRPSQNAASAHTFARATLPQ